MIPLSLYTTIRRKVKRRRREDTWAGRGYRRTGGGKVIYRERRGIEHKEKEDKLQKKRRGKRRNMTKGRERGNRKRDWKRSRQELEMKVKRQKKKKRMTWNGKVKREREWKRWKKR